MTFSISKLLFKSRPTKIYFSEGDAGVKEYSLRPSQSVLDALLERGHDIPNSCRAGDCQSCVLKSSNPDALPPQSQRGLNQAEKSLGYFLSCSCFPTQDLQVTPLQTLQHAAAEVLESFHLSKDVFCLRLKRALPVEAGQYLNLFHPNGESRSYSVASANTEDYLEFHIKKVDKGLFSAWASTDLRPGDILKIQGPFGKCIYTPGHKHYLLGGIGTGYSPLRGILLQILNDKSNSAAIDIVLGGKSKDGIYASEELISLAERYPQLKLHLITLDKTHKPFSSGDIYDYVKSSWPNLSNSVVYLCGAPSFVQKMKKLCFLSDAPMSNIFSDPFTPAAQ